MLRSCTTKVAKEEHFVAKKASKYLECCLKQSI